MDDKVIAAMARWPDVPDVYGWLSLSERGEWRLHPQGDALLPEHCQAQALSLGEPITSPQILQFMHRNYAADTHGQWYFQNGPQRVFVRLDAAPHIFHTLGGTTLHSHTGQTAAMIQGWWLDDGGKLYASTDLGPGLVAGRDMAALLGQLALSDGRNALDALEQGLADGPVMVIDSKGGDAALHCCHANDIAGILGFVRCPALDRITP